MMMTEEEVLKRQLKRMEEDRKRHIENLLVFCVVWMVVLLIGIVGIILI